MRHMYLIRIVAGLVLCLGHRATSHNTQQLLGYTVNPNNKTVLNFSDFHENWPLTVFYFDEL